MNSKPLTMMDVEALAQGLNHLSHNLWWTWNHDAQELFHELSPRAWQNLYHNAVAVLHELSDYELRVRLLDPSFAARVRDVLARFEDYMAGEKTWASCHVPSLTKNPVAYFSAEFGFHETLPIAAGGLGVLAGDHTKAASDLGLGLVGVSLFYREGFFQQSFNHENWQVEHYTQLNPASLPMEPVLDSRGEPILDSIEIATSRIQFQLWRVNVGRCHVYLLDTNRPENEPSHRDLTLHLYGGDKTMRIMQEIVLGIGGIRVLRKLGIEPSLYHMNEGHSAFLILELLRERIQAGHSFPSALAWVKERCVFTTHTPVEAGHDRFHFDLVHYVFGDFIKKLGLSISELMALGRVRPDQAGEPFCMTVLALKASRAANGVSELHGRISRRMWLDLYPGKTEDQIPIGHITNGIHLTGWMKAATQRFWQGKVGPDWQSRFQDPDFWKCMADPQFVTDEEIWALRFQMRRELIEFARRRLLLQDRRLEKRDFISFDRLLNPDALTIGFARRFATYKRAPLIFQRFDDVVRLASNPARPVQFIYAGKAHPQDQDGKRFIQHIIHLSKYSSLQGSLVFLEDYDIHVARQMVSGCDVWLNNPRRPLEASGTSGQKTAIHGALNLSILDGWWREGYDGANGFAIGDDSHPDSVEEQDRRDSENLYRVLSEQVIPLFYQRDEQGIPRQWIARIRRAMATLIPQFNTWRMVRDYARKYYQPDAS